MLSYTGGQALQALRTVLGARRVAPLYGSVDPGVHYPVPPKASYQGDLSYEDGTPKKALRHFADYTPELGICQWFHFEDHRLDDAVQWLRKLGVRKLRTGLSWTDSHRPDWEPWFDKQMKALEEFDVTVTFCFTPGSCGKKPHHTSPPHRPEEFADFCAHMVRRYT